MHRFANPARFLRLARWLTPICLLLGLAITTAVIVYGLFYAPPERLQGETARILFLHVPAAWLGMAGWTTIAIASFVELVWRHPLAALAARAAAVPGALFTALGLLTGSIWGRPAWGTWWVWDGRLTSFLVLLFLYFGYIALAGALDREGGNGRIAAIFGIVGAVNIPIIHYSVIWWNSLHQPPSITTGGTTMSGEYLYALLAGALGFSLIFGAVILMRMRELLANAQTAARLRRRAAGAQEEMI